MPIANRSLPPVSEIRRRRRQLGLSQVELANASGVSQSFLAKIERGAVEPSYRNVAAILTALEGFVDEHAREVTVGELATRSLVSVRRSTLVTEAAHVLRRHAISQVPVVEDGFVVGALTDRVIVECLTDAERIARLPRLTVGEVLEAPFPQVDAGTPSHVAAALLRHVPAVLVTRGGRLSGIVTQSDLLKRI